MIPNIFVSSTIADLHYLRDGLRDAIEELSYHPIMSEHGEVGYLHPNTAAESCYRGVRQCQMVVLIVGKRYGTAGEDGLSVTHKEFLAAKEEHLPIITFVEPQVLNYKEVFHTDPKAEIWNNFTPMDSPRKTFQLLDEIASSDSFNAIIPFTSVGDAKKQLKLQLADFVGDRLSETILPMDTQLRDVFAEISTVRNLLVHSSETLQSKEKDAKRFHAVTRLLLNDNAAEYRKVLEQIFGDIDAAIAIVVDRTSFEEVLTAAGFTYDIVEDTAARETFFDMRNEAGLPPGRQPVYGSYGMRGGYTIYANKHMRVSQSIFLCFDGLQKTLHAKANLA